MPDVIKLVGAPQSPYSRKMRAALRYRRIPFQWVRQGSAANQGQPQVKINSMIPVLWFCHEDSTQDTAMLDSTFQLQHLEGLYTARSLQPADPVVTFFDRLLEDFADEWLTKAMFHYRWSNPQDTKKAGTVLPLEARWDCSDEQVKGKQEAFAQRQVSRLGVVGSNDTTAPLIEESYKNVLCALNEILIQQPFIMGHRPGAADFAFFGQLACLALFDPSSQAVTLEYAPRVYAWVESMEDLSGDEVNSEDWVTRTNLPLKWSKLLKEVGRTYVPFLLGNAQAVENKQEQVVCQIDGREWTQKTFPYQYKCLLWLRAEFVKLSAQDQMFVFKVLEGSGVDLLFSS